MQKLACASTIALALASGAAVAAEIEYGGTWCGHSKVKTLVAGPELTVLSTETWAIETPGSSRPAALENAAVHCVGYLRVLKGKPWRTAACHFKNAAGDTLTGEAVSEPDKPGTWTFLHGTGVWKGIQGGGHYQIVSRGKLAQGSLVVCLKHSGAYTVPTQ